MFKTIKNYLSERREREYQNGQLGNVSQTKRWLFKGVASAGVAFAAVGAVIGLGSREKDEKIDYQAAYDQDVLPGDKILQKNGFEEISREEADAMVQMFVDDYEKKRQV